MQGPRVHPLHQSLSKIDVTLDQLPRLRGASWVTAMRIAPPGSLFNVHSSPWSAIAGLPRLRRLHLERLCSAPASIAAVPRLELDALHAETMSLEVLPPLRVGTLRVKGSDKLVELSSTLDAQVVHVTGCAVGSLSGLRTCTRLETLVVSGLVDGLGAIEASTKSLRRLDVSGEVKDLSPLRGATQLTHVHLAHTQISSLDALGESDGLLEVAIRGAPVTDLRPLRNCRKLRVLDLRGCQSLRSLEPIAHLPLEHVFLFNTDFEPSDVPPSLEHRVSWAPDVLPELFDHIDRAPTIAWTFP